MQGAGRLKEPLGCTRTRQPTSAIVLRRSGGGGCTVECDGLGSSRCPVPRIVMNHLIPTPPLRLGEWARGFRDFEIERLPPYHRTVKARTTSVAWQWRGRMSPPYSPALERLGRGDMIAEGRDTEETGWERKADGDRGARGLNKKLFNWSIDRGIYPCIIVSDNESLNEWNDQSINRLNIQWDDYLICYSGI